MHRKQRAARIQPEGRIEILFGDLTQRDGFTHSCAGVEDVNPALFAFDCIEQAVEVVEIGGVAAHAGDIAADRRDGFVERVLPAAGDENIGAFFDEALGAGQGHAARAAGDDGHLTLKLSHDIFLSGSAHDRSGCPDRFQIGQRWPGLQCEAVHIGGAKTIHLGHGLGCPAEFT